METFDLNRSFETEALGCMSFDEFELKLLDMYDDAMVDIDHRIQKKVDDMVAISQRPAEVPPMGTEY